MRNLRPLFLLPLALAACVQAPQPADRAASPVLLPMAVPSGPVVLQAQYAVQNVNIVVPRTLKVSEANVFFPVADIVWRGEAKGDRHTQVQAILTEAAAAATGPMQAGRPVNVTVEIQRFHCLTEKTRYTVGGTHSMHFLLTVTDAATGQVLDGPRPVVADVKAAGGAQAIAEDQAGRTQRVVVVERLTEVLRRELSVQVTDPEVISRAVMPTGVL